MAKAQLRQYVFNATSGTIEVPGKFDLQQFLVITDTTKNIILYNFADNTFVGTTVSFTRLNDNNFTNALDNTDGTTILQLSSAAIALIAANGITSSDTLQILYEQPFQYTRMPEAGTDAFERIRVAAPQSLLDADFEYGMQPTKWLTISQQRAYPAIYEIPGTDLTVTAATTDASVAEGGTAINESLITITTSVAHGYTAGSPITIRGFNSAYTGFDRAEGSFVVYRTPSATTFTYYAKGKVGYNNNDNIYTPFIQLRQGGFYTGSNVNAIISTTATATASGTNYVTVVSSTGMTSGAPITFSTVQTNAVATQSTSLAGVQNNNYITVGSTIGMYANMPLLFSGTSFGGLTSGTTYYVQTIVDSRTLTVVTTSSGSTNPTLTAAIGGNMYVVGGASFGNIVSGTQYYVNTVVNGTTITISNNIVYSTNITATNATNNYVTFGTTANMTVGEAVVTGGSGSFGNLTTSTTYYVLQIIDSRNAILTATSGSTVPFAVSTATGTFGVTVGANLTLTTVSAGFLAAISVNAPTFTVDAGHSSAPSYTATSTSSTLVGSTLTVGGTITGTFAIGQGLSGSGVPSGVTITGSAANGGGTGSGGSGTYTVTYTGNLSTANLSSGQTINGMGTPATITVNTTSPHGFTPGDTVNILQTSESNYNNHILASGPYFVETTPSSTTFTYTSRANGIITVGSGIIAQLYARPDSFYSHRPFDGGVQLGTGLPAHGSQAIRMSKKYIRYQSGKAINFNTGLLMAPNYFVRTVTSNTTVYQTGVSIAAVTSTSGVITVQSGTYVQGSQITISGSSNTTYLPNGIYFIMTGGTSVTSITISTSYFNAVNATPATLVVGSVTATATVYPAITVVTDDVDHGCQVGATVTLSGVLTPGYNGTYTVSGIIDERTIVVSAPNSLQASSGVAGAVVTDPCLLSINYWTGATVRSGTFDEQNGVYWAYDGQVVYVGRRSSTFQLAGTATVVVGSGQIIGINTRFTSQLWAGDRIVIRGMTHLVTQVVSDTLMYVNPQYRGAASVSGIKITKTIDRMIPQSQWNVDTMDGSNGPKNPSGFQIIPTKMQMVAMQWTWYGAGFIDWMMRGPEGKYVTVHRLRNNNLNNEAWMRAGNLPVRYEVQNESARTNTVGSTTGTGTAGYSLSASDTVMTVQDTTQFPVPAAGYSQAVLVDNEIITYTGKVNTYATATAATLISATGTIGTVSGSGPYTATITGMTSTTGLVASTSIITAVAGVVGTLGSGVVTVTAINSGTSINISSTAVITAGAITNITAQVGLSSTTSGYSSAYGPVVVASTAGMAIGQPIVFTNPYANTIGNLNNNTTYFILSIGLYSGSPAITLSNSYSNYGSNISMPQLSATAVTTLGYMYTNALTGLSRAQPISPWASGGQRTFTAGSASTHTTTGVILINGTASPIVSHWGAAFIEDGGFDGDRSYIFNYSQPNVNISTKKTTAFAIRLAPSVSNALPGDLGQRELINRASFLLQTLESSAGSGAGNAALVIEGIINPSNMPSISNIQFASMNSVANPTGQPSFSQVAPGSSMVFQNAVNNFLNTPIYIAANTTALPLTSNPATASSGSVAVSDDVSFPTSTASLYGLTRVSALVNTTSVFTSTISVGTTATISAGSISGTTLTATTVSAGTLAVGMVLTGTNVTTGTYIVASIGGGTGSGSTWTVSISQTTPSTSITATAQQASITFTSGSAIATGSLVTGGTIPSNTYITGQISGTTGGTGVYSLVNLAGTSITGGQNPTGTTYYAVTLNQATLAAIPLIQNGTQANFSRSTYALPGETVFSYINAPANKDSLDLSSFKELTNTPIGGRGCYPNGCDILFVNAYITQGSPINQNLVLRWGEAQA